MARAWRERRGGSEEEVSRVTLAFGSVVFLSVMRASVTRDSENKYYESFCPRALSLRDPIRSHVSTAQNARTPPSLWIRNLWSSLALGMYLQRFVLVFDCFVSMAG